MHAAAAAGDFEGRKRASDIKKGESGARVDRMFFFRSASEEIYAERGRERKSQGDAREINWGGGLCVCGNIFLERCESSSGEDWKKN